ncbi:MAG: DUF1694 domain-containing protein [Cetobacterium sp.]|uniref:DUF1694 domain-containing protein n=1 Tax=unclassified Cetobacterium TaxID=2630983 RepID=UPI00163BDEC1|nr:DUF1694 domain-containing protein [Cetobacterium sp. 2A]MBC2856277.1 DUF1694 domain-containing protein [Cetobacterium sp. 2A]
MERELINQQEKARMKFFKTQMEKNYYLGEFKENVIIALNKDEIENGKPYIEVLEAMKEHDAVLLKMRRDIPLKYFKPYIQEAEKIGLRYTLMDGITLLGDIGLVVVAKEALDNSDYDVTLENAGQKFVQSGLSEGYAYAMGKKISRKHYKELKEKMPSHIGNFKKFGIWDVLLGKECPIDKFEREKGRSK